MTVKELIEKLKTLPEDATVEIAYSYGSDSYSSSSLYDVEKDISLVVKEEWENVVRLCTDDRQETKDAKQKRGSK